MKNLIKCLMLGFVVVGFVGCDSVSGVFDKFSYDEVFEGVSKNERKFCVMCERSNFGITYGICGKFIPPSELADEEKGLIGVCEYTKKAERKYWDYGYKNDELKKECKTGQKETDTGLMKVDEKSGTLLIENKYKIIDIVESAEYGVGKGEYGQGLCKKREIYKLKRGQPKK